MSIFRGYTDGLASSYGVATYQTQTFQRPQPQKRDRRSFATILKVLVQKLAAKLASWRGRKPAPSDDLSDLPLFAQAIGT